MQRKRVQCHVCSAKNKETRMIFKRRECNINLCTASRFEVYHTELHLRGSTDTKMGQPNTQMSVNTATEITD
jgi:hypothetical protein